MPFKSKAQQRAMHAKAERGEISKEVVKEFDKKTDFKKLPERKSKKRSSALDIANAAAEMVEKRRK